MKARLNEEMRFYLKEIASKPVLTRQQEVDLFKKLENNEPGAREAIVEANLRFVIKIALGFSGRGIPISDLVQEGNIGLLEVVDKFDYSRGYRFSTYAAFWIRQAIQIAIRKQCNVIRLPIRKSRMLGYMTEAVNDFTNAHGRTPSPRELALLLKLDESKVEQLMQLRDSVLSLDVETDEEGGQLIHRLEDHSTPSPFDRYVERETQSRVHNALSSLSEKEQRVLRLRYGFGTGKNLSLRTTSKIVGMSQEGVRRVERTALKKLRRPSAKTLVSDLL